MVNTAGIITEFASAVREVLAAEAVSVFVPLPAGRVWKPLLVHDGAEPVAELETVDSAEAFHEAHASADEPAAGSAPGSILIPLVPRTGVAVAGRAGRRDRRGDGERHNRRQPIGWLAVRVAESAVDPAALSEWKPLIDLGVSLAAKSIYDSSMLLDPVSGLPDRVEVQGYVAHELENIASTGEVLSLVLLNPDHFSEVNQRLGHQRGDVAIVEIGQRLRGALRASDFVGRYGGLIFAVALVGIDGRTAKRVAEKLIAELSEPRYIDGEVSLTFSAGIASTDTVDPPVRDHADLFRAADKALYAAKQAGGTNALLWSNDTLDDVTGHVDRLHDIFTGNMSKDYRNMRLLWESINTIASTGEVDDIVERVTRQVFASLRPGRVGMFVQDREGTLELRAQASQDGAEFSLSGERTAIVERACRSGSPVESEDRNGAVRAYAIPLTGGDETLGCIFLEGANASFKLDSADLNFFEGLAAQLGLNLDRARLLAENARRQASEQQQLHSELNELREALEQSRLLYRSDKMEQLLAVVRRIAPTDATALITGESGTGKELLARTIHQLSPRRKKPLVVVDCGAIASTLIDSELFGRERGAYTGAEQTSPGRLAEAEGGTVLLDEIGEMPLEVQSKLLRFVQEKQFTSVGGTKPKTVDVRILAATNRQLDQEVAEGRFRKDLLYRLKVIHLDIPPLRERRDDIVHLAKHFVELYALQYAKPAPTLTEDAERALVAHRWAGNVRELQNRMMQAVILCEDGRIRREQLRLDNGGETDLPEPPILAGVPAAQPPREEGNGAAHDAWSQLRLALSRQVDGIVSGRTPAAAPLGRWINDDLVLAANEAAGRVARKAAETLGLPETTFRRRLSKARQQAAAGLAVRNSEWETVRSVLSPIVRDSADGADLIARAQRVLLEEVLQRLDDDISTAAAVLGVTAPTFKRRVAELRDEAGRDAQDVD